LISFLSSLSPGRDANGQRCFLAGLPEEEQCYTKPMQIL